MPIPRPNRRAIIIITAFVVMAAAIVLVNNQPPAKTVPASVAATIYPLYDLTRSVSGNAIEVRLLLPPGASPHTFEPTPSAMRELQDTVAVYAIGHGLDQWATALAADSGAAVVTVDRGISLIQSAEDEGDAYDPHYWLSIANAKTIAANVADDLSTRFPEHASEFRSNLVALMAELDTTDRKIKSDFEHLPNKKMVTLHDAWYYFAEEYGLEITGSFEPSPGREPTPQYLAELGRAVESAGAKAIYSEPQLSTATLRPFAEDHGLTIAILDPLGGTAGRETFSELMLHNAQVIKENQ